jgi:L-lactate dehydrogenase (cytochrome)
MGRFDDILALQDFEAAARRRLPRSLQGYISGGAEDDWTLRANRAAFGQWAIVPRVLVDTSQRTCEHEFMGRRYAAPFGIAPMGGAGLVAFEADLALARAALRANVPFVLSGTAVVRMEEVIAVNPQAWFQAYLPSSQSLADAIVGRAAAAGYRTLVVTVDVPVAPNRENNLRNGYSNPLRPSLRLALDALRHPRWLATSLLRTLCTRGMPHLENAGPARAHPLISRSAAPLPSREAYAWPDIERLRERWRGQLVLKGVLAPEDAARARRIGVDAIVVSNHGGRQLDGCVASLQMLPVLAAEAGPMRTILDGGVRRGVDVLKALALGADLVLVGRPFLQAAAIGGEAGIGHAISLLHAEVQRDLALAGCVNCAELAGRVVRAAQASNG